VRKIYSKFVELGLNLKQMQTMFLWVKIDRKRKVAVTSLLRAFGLETDQEILDAFKDVETNPDIKFIESTLAKDAAKTMDDGLIEVY